MDYVFMCAAETHGAAVIRSNPLSLVTSTLVMNALTLNACYRAGVKKVLFVSSSVVYPEENNLILFKNYEDDTWCVDPPPVYYHVGWMKRYSEILCRIYSEKIERTMPCVVVRPANVYGPRDCFDPEKSHVTAATIRKVADRNNPIEVWGDGEDRRDVIYVDDLVEGALLAFEKIDGYNPVNIATGEVYSVKEILATALKVDGYDNANVVYNVSKPTTIKARALSASKAKELLGFEAKTSLEEGIRKTIAWYRDNK
jgi:GDP-L-fucose synthase